MMRELDIAVMQYKDRQKEIKEKECVLEKMRQRTEQAMKMRARR